MYEIGAETSLKACSMLNGNERVDANAKVWFGPCT